MTIERKMREEEFDLETAALRKRLRQSLASRRRGPAVSPDTSLPKLMERLKEVAASAGKPEQAALDTLHQINRAFEEFEDRKLDEIRQQGLKDRLEAAELDIYPADFAEALVRQTAPEFGPVQQRAVALLSGEEPKRGEEPKYHRSLLEDRARDLADRVRAEWPTRPRPPSRSRGRPAGVHEKATMNGVPASIAELVTVVLPPIEDLMGAKVTTTIKENGADDIAASSPGLAAVHAAVQLFWLTAELETVRRAVAQLHHDQEERRRQEAQERDPDPSLPGLDKAINRRWPGPRLPAPRPRPAIKFEE